jgi:histidinol dehydrogenase
VFVGRASATAFGDYLAGSNHVLPTGGAARFASALSPRVFRRRTTEVRVGDAAALLARPGAAVARAEGFEAHATSMEARIGENRGRP